jgi:quercetin dioxygenase-like cupin family protein
VSVVAKGADVLVREYVLDPGELIPWHHHSQVTDRFFCLEGEVHVETREPAERHSLSPGDRLTVAPPTIHQVTNASGATCRFLLVQGVGQHDFLPA